MKLFVTIVWASAVFVLTCASDSGFWLKGEPPRFHWNGTADYAELAKGPTEWDRMEWIVRKIGHFASFGALAAFLVRTSGSRRASFIIAVLYAIGTELAQLHFHRDGRFLDMLIDAAGIVCFLLMMPAKELRRAAGRRRRTGRSLRTAAGK